MPRFVILRHDPGENSSHPCHWDFMLEQGSVLRTWALASEPCIGLSIPARQLPDHRLAYLDYEGEVSGGRGTVTRWDSGTFEIISESSTGLLIQLAGNQLHGAAALTPVAVGNSAGDWQFQLSAQPSA